jgi:hypothetical protein
VTKQNRDGKRVRESRSWQLASIADEFEEGIVDAEFLNERYQELLRTT